jgi:hypothetical protein
LSSRCDWNWNKSLTIKKGLFWKHKRGAVQMSSAMLDWKNSFDVRV